MKVLLILLAFVATASADPYQGIRYNTTTGQAFEHLSGSYSLAASTASYSTYTIVLNGVDGSVTATSFVGSGAASTTTFAGWVDFGLSIAVNACAGAANCRAGCGAGVRVVGGGCASTTGQATLKSFPSTETDSSTLLGTAVASGGYAYSWSCNIAGASGVASAYAICARIK